MHTNQKKVLLFAVPALIVLGGVGYLRLQSSSNSGLQGQVTCTVPPDECTGDPEEIKQHCNDDITQPIMDCDTSTCKWDTSVCTAATADVDLQPSAGFESTNTTCTTATFPFEIKVHNNGTSAAPSSTLKAEILNSFGQPSGYVVEKSVGSIAANGEATVSFIESDFVNLANGESYLFELNEGFSIKVTTDSEEEIAETSETNQEQTYGPQSYIPCAPIFELGDIGTSINCPNEDWKLGVEVKNTGTEGGNALVSVSMNNGFATISQANTPVIAAGGSHVIYFDAEDFQADLSTLVGQTVALDITVESDANASPASSDSTIVDAEYNACIPDYQFGNIAFVDPPETCKLAPRSIRVDVHNDNGTGHGEVGIVQVRIIENETGKVYKKTRATDALIVGDPAQTLLYNIDSAWQPTIPGEALSTDYTYNIEAEIKAITPPEPGTAWTEDSNGNLSENNSIITHNCIADLVYNMPPMLTSIPDPSTGEITGYQFTSSINNAGNTDVTDSFTEKVTVTYNGEQYSAELTRAGGIAAAMTGIYHTNIDSLVSVAGETLTIGAGGHFEAVFHADFGEDIPESSDENNTVEMNDEFVSILPDLVPIVEYAAFYDAANTKLTVKTDIWNYGSMEANDVDVSVQVKQNGETVFTFPSESISSILGNEKASLELTVPYSDGWNPEAESHRIFVEVDPSNTVEEVDDFTGIDNNTTSIGADQSLNNSLIDYGTLSSPLCVGQPITITEDFVQSGVDVPPPVSSVSTILLTFMPDGTLESGQNLYYGNIDSVGTSSYSHTFTQHTEPGMYYIYTHLYSLINSNPIQTAKTVDDSNVARAYDPYFEVMPADHAACP